MSTGTGCGWALSSAATWQPEVLYYESKLKSLKRYSDE